MEKKFKGRGAQINIDNKFLKQQYVTEYIEGLDEPLLQEEKTTAIHTYAKTIVNKVDSPDLGLMYSINPYQGCEHGCVYCYARNSHEYWGFSAGVDFEKKILVKKNAPRLLEQYLQHPKWKAYPIMLSGNTDCYQPLERKYKITREILKIFLKYKHPVGIISKNALILRDLDIIEQLAKDDLIHVNISITSSNEKLRSELEPRTSSIKNRLKAVEVLSNIGVPVNVMIAPIIPGLNDHQIPSIIQESAKHGASSVAYTIVRLNGHIGKIFEDWIKTVYPGKAEKVLNQIASCHGGKLNDSRYGMRMTGEGNEASMIKRLFGLGKRKYMKKRKMTPLNTSLFIKAPKGQLSFL